MREDIRLGDIRLGDIRLGAVLRELRRARGLTLAAVARRAGCDQALISFVELGHRRLHSWLAERLDQIYETGGVVATLARGAGDAAQDLSVSGTLMSDVFVVQLPQGGIAIAAVPARGADRSRDHWRRVTR